MLQDARINVHMCLLNCEGAALVAGGSLHNYTAGSLVAFEDRLDHESAQAIICQDRLWTHMRNSSH